MENKIITIVGGTGFLGRYVVRRLAKAGYVLRVIAREPEAAAYLKTAGDPGQIVLMGGDLARPESLTGKIDGSWAVINLAGILFESGKQTFAAIHAQGAERLAQMAASARAERFIQISALGIDRAASSHYARSKLLGEKAVLAAFPAATILRPSVMFGAEDNFINQFARLATLSPLLPLIGGGRTKFQPVYVDDVAAAIETCLNMPNTKGQTYELGGPSIYTFKEILHYMLRVTGRHRGLMPLPFSVASLMGAAANVLPTPPLTADQVRLLKFDNVVSPAARTFAALSIKPTTMDEVVPYYLRRYRKHAKAAA
jgi:uncharacterized protein YbjT (DUF2867 family)